MEEIQKKLDESEQEKAALLEKANADAKRMISEAKQSATALGEQKAQEAVAQAQTILNKAQEAARRGAGCPSDRAQTRVRSSRCCYHLPSDWQGAQCLRSEADQRRSRF